MVAEADLVSAAAGQLAGLRSSLSEAAAAAAAPTTGIAAAASDEISAAIARIFGTFGQDFQAVNSQAAAFNAEFVRLLNGSASAYVTAEIANAERTLLGGAFGYPTAATDPLGGLLGGLLGGGTTSGGGGLPTGGLTGLLGPLTGGTGALNLLSPALTPLLGGLGGLPGPLGPVLGGLGTSLQNLLAPQALVAPNFSAYPSPYQTLFENTVRNLGDLGANYRLFPILNQIAVNQAHYAQLAAHDFALNLQGFPANVPTNVQLGLQYASTFNLGTQVENFVKGTTGFYGVLGTQLGEFSAGIQQTFPTFQHDLNLAGNAIQQGNYHQAVQYSAHAFIDLFITGFDTSGLGISVSLNPLGVDISGPIGVEGPAGALLPILTAIGQQAQGAASLVPAGTIPGMMARNFANGIGTLTDAGVSADFVLGLTLPPSLTGEAIFGLPLQLGFAVLGSPFAGLDGLAEGATAFSTAMASGNLLAAANAIGNTPAYVMDGFLNGEVIIDQPLPVTVELPVIGIPVTIPVIAHLPLAGLLVPPHGISASVPLNQIVPILGLPDITVPLGGTEFGGLFPFLLNTLPQQVAQSMSYTNTL
ncbi:PE family protein [Mycobacterium asiaticum]|uniref:PE family protein n=1 Tax=Mycobacterium asiaticum TaxID=1790 RepID=UPI0012DB60EC|nr:PE family protein [Mycobacterium asiaticum]